MNSRTAGTRSTVSDDASVKAERDGGAVLEKPTVHISTSPISAPERPSQAASQDWMHLFNGKDLDGWMTHPSQPGNWRVENGIIIGSGPDESHLYTERGDYKDFDLLIEARINDRGNSGLYFRATSRPVVSRRDPAWPGPEGYEAQINSTNWNRDRTGSLRAAGHPVTVIRDAPVRPGEWFTLEVIAVGNHIVIRVNGATATDYTDEKRMYSSGHIALQKVMPATVAEFRRVEIKELNGTR
jgi:hypothetical protein